MWTREYKKTYMQHYQADNKDALSAYNKSYHQKWYLLRRYNMTAEQWDAMFEAQGRKCKGCGTDQPWNKHGWEIDHDHLCCPGKTSCGKCVRGILCKGCNSALGAIRDDLSRLKRLVLYLESFQK